ncbi:hypothetical protein BX666DRAFT_1932210 [Dichotomocladium elegans]|nr:hypothetical protein BX666DRAFT_1932210 [Dichotomocladium elegans]
MKKAKKKEKKRHLHVIDNPDPETAKNTALNSMPSTPGGLAVVANERNRKGKSSGNSKSVSFVTAAKTIDDADYPGNSSSSSSGSSSSSTSSSSGSESEMDDDKKQSDGNGLVINRNTGLSCIVPVDPNTIRVRTASGKIFECQRQCPHKGVDLVRYGRVQGDTLICAKHDWHFDLSNPSMGRRTIRACQVSDW